MQCRSLIKIIINHWKEYYRSEDIMFKRSKYEQYKMLKTADVDVTKNKYLSILSRCVLFVSVQPIAEFVCRTL